MARVSEIRRRTSSAVKAELALAGGTEDKEEMSVEVVDWIGSGVGESLDRRVASSSRRICWTWLAV